MAKYNKNSGSGVGKFFAIFFALLLGGAIVLGAIYWDHVKVIWGDIVRYFQRVDEEVPNEDETPSDDETSVVSGNLVAEQVSSEGLSLAMTPMLASDGTAENSVQVNVTVAPEYSHPQNIKWELSFVEPMTTEGAAWVAQMETEGKTLNDYIGLESEYSAESNTVYCYAPFGAQIQLKVYNTSYPTVNAVCAIDYEKRVDDVYVKIQGNFGGTRINLASPFGTSSQGLNISKNEYGPMSLELEYSTGTISPAGTQFSIGISESFASYLQEQGILGDEIEFDYTETYGDVIFYHRYIEEGEILSYSYFGLLFENGTEIPQSTEEFDAILLERGESYKVAYNNYAKENDASYIARVLVNTGKSGVFNSILRTDSSKLFYIETTDIELDTPSIVF